MKLSYNLLFILLLLQAPTTLIHTTPHFLFLYRSIVKLGHHSGGTQQETVMEQHEFMQLPTQEESQKDSDTEHETFEEQLASGGVNPDSREDNLFLDMFG